jgi:flagellar motility protein MotE (MotC chaperone)
MKLVKIGIVLVVLAGISFGSSFFISSKMVKKADASQTATTKPESLASPAQVVQEMVLPDSQKEQQLDSLVKELRHKLEDCRRRQEELDQREGRLQLAQESLQKRSEELEAIQLKLVTPLTALKEAQADFKRQQVVVALQEKTNLKRTAAIYEKMDPAKCARILSDMCSGSQEDDAAKILHFMSERGAAKLMAEISDKGLAASLTEKLKTIHEEN